MLQFLMFYFGKNILSNTLFLGIFAIVIAVVYTIIIYFFYSKKTRRKYLHIKDNEFLLNWLNTLIGTFVSFLLGFAVLNYTNNYQKQVKSNEERQKYVTLLLEELKDLKKLVSSENQYYSVIINGNTYTTYIDSFPNVVIEDSIKSGYFNQEKTARLLIFIRSMRLHALYVNYFMNTTINPNTNEDAIKNASKWVNQTKDYIKSNIDIIITDIEQEKELTTLR